MKFRSYYLITLIYLFPVFMPGTGLNNENTDDCGRKTRYRQVNSSGCNKKSIEPGKTLDIR